MGKLVRLPQAETDSVAVCPDCGSYLCVIVDPDKPLGDLNEFILGFRCSNPECEWRVDKE